MASEISADGRDILEEDISQSDNVAEKLIKESYRFEIIDFGSINYQSNYTGNHGNNF